MATLAEIGKELEEVEIDFDAIDKLKAADKAAATDTATEPARLADPKTVSIEKPPKLVRKPADEPVTVITEDDEPAPVATATPVITVDEGIEKLKAQLAAEKAAREAAERRARDAAESEVRARTENQDTRLTLVTQAITQVKQTNDMLKAQYVEALTVQDFAKVADLQIEMASNAAKLQDLERGKIALEKAPKPTPTLPDDPVEKMAAQCTPRSAQWVRAHPEFALDPKKNRRMLAAHYDAIEDGIAPDTPEYFAAIENTLGLRAESAPTLRAEPTTDTALSGAAAPAAQSKSRQIAPAAAPVSRNGTGNGSSPRSVRLSSAEREMAKNMGMSDEEYARNKLALQREGQLN